MKSKSLKDEIDTLLSHCTANNDLKDSDLLKPKDIFFFNLITKKPILKMKLIYKATIDGWTPIKFNKCVAGYSPIFVIIKTGYDRIFGGYTEIPFKLFKNMFKEGLSEEVYHDSNAVIFSLTN